MNQPNPFQVKPKKTRQHHASFIEALKNIGSGTVQSFKDDLIKGSSNNGISAFPNSTSYRNEPGSSTYNSFDRLNPNAYTPEWLNQQNQEAVEAERQRQRLKEVNLTPLYDRRQQEVESQIKSLREELSALARDIGKLGTSVQKAIEQEIENPGTYHVNYFEKLKKFILNLRKQVSQSANWLEISNQRKNAKRYYWGQVKQSGTKFMLSSERNMVTQTG